MSIGNKLKSLGVDVHEQISVVRMINALSITDTQKTLMLRQYLTELRLTLDPDAKKAAGFPV